MTNQWRVGRKVGRTLYIQRGDDAADGDDLIGMVDTRELAQIVVTAVNTRMDTFTRLTMAEMLLDYGRSLHRDGETLDRTWRDWREMIEAYFRNESEDA